MIDPRVFRSRPNPLRRVMSFGIKKFSTRSQRVLIVAAFITASLTIGAISFVRYRSTRTEIQSVNYSDLYAIAEAGSAASVLIDNDAVQIKRTDGTVVQSTV